MLIRGWGGEGLGIKLVAEHRAPHVAGERLRLPAENKAPALVCGVSRSGRWGVLLERPMHQLSGRCVVLVGGALMAHMS